MPLPNTIYLARDDTDSLIRWWFYDGKPEWKVDTWGGETKLIGKIEPECVEEFFGGPDPYEGKDCSEALFEIKLD